MHLPERIECSRLVLRRPRLDDATAIFAGWAADPIATRYMMWRRRAVDLWDAQTILKEDMQRIKPLRVA